MKNILIYNTVYFFILGYNLGLNNHIWSKISYSLLSLENALSVHFS